MEKAWGPFEEVRYKGGVLVESFGGEQQVHMEHKVFREVRRINSLYVNINSIICKLWK